VGAAIFASGLDDLPTSRDTLTNRRKPTMNGSKLASLRTPIVSALLAFCVGCAGLQPPVEVPSGLGKKQTVTVTASSFEFRPNHIVARAGDALTLELNNSSSMTHNFTIEDPDGNVLTSVDLPGEGAVQVPIPLKQPGVYEFYCDRPMHSTLGMKGRIEAH
jgi:plastocyanin